MATETTVEPTDAAKGEKRRGKVDAKGLLKSMAIGLGFALVIIVATLWGLQRSIIYPGSGPHVPAEAGWTETRLTVPGSGQVSAYSLPAKPGKPTVLFLHGNATGYLGGVRANKAFADAGFGVFVPEWPGYAGNPGSTTQQTIDDTADAAMKWLSANSVKSDDIIIYGNSIGAGAAIHAARLPHRRLLIVSGVASLPQVVQSMYPFIPAGLVKDDRDNAEAIKAVKGKITIVHAPDDDLVPYTQGEALAAAAKVPVISVPGGHQLAWNGGLQQSLAENFDK